MKARFVGLLVAVLACTAWEVQAQERDLKFHLLPIKPSPPPAPLAPVVDPEEQPVIITGVTNERGQPEAVVFVRIKSTGVGDFTGADGAYRLVVPRARIIPEQPMVIVATCAGLYPVARTITLAPGVRLTRDIQMEVVKLYMTGTGGAWTEDAGFTRSKAGAERGVSASSGLVRRKARCNRARRR